VGWITGVSPASGSTTTETDTITVSIDRSGLIQGTHTGTITIAPQYYGRPQQIIVTCESGASPEAPSPASPADGATKVSTTPLLQASAFLDSDSGDTHAASQWQVDDSSDFSSPVFDRVETTGDLTHVTVSGNRLTYHAYYYWRVRYRDSTGQWSPWSAAPLFRCRCNAVGADLDDDCDVDQADLLLFRPCALGEARPPVDPDCEPVDFDLDQDVDQSDFGIFQRCLGPSNVAADASCLE